MRTHRLERAQIIPRPRAEVFAFFSDAANLERITPPFLRFRILTPLPIEMRAGAAIEYRLRLHGIPMRWQSRIETWEPGLGFTDVQLSGPYRRWVHRHEFRDAPGGTEMRDAVEYALPLGPLGDLAHALLVRRSVEAIFDYRRDAVAALLGGPAGRGAGVSARPR
ncbi:MAG TPA: SRPBCC family protein [Anaeromyxobacteraceae bacterium]|nr:SRPBCC family protein [Anaeromyxobacteraceae bacterium]